MQTQLSSISKDSREQAGQEQGSRTWSVQGSASLSLVPDNSQLRIPTGTQACESRSISLQVGRLAMPEYCKLQKNIDLNCAATRTCESALLIKKISIIKEHWLENLCQGIKAADAW